MSGILAALAGIKTAIATAVDEYFNRVTLLLPGNGTNGAQNNTFLDSSSNNFTITRNGNTTQGTFSPFSQTGWSNYFDGTGDYLNFTAQSFTGDFTLEAWIYPTRLIDSGGQGTIFASVSPNNQLSISSSGGNLSYYNGSTNTTATSAISTNVWQHVAISRSGSTTRVFVGGALLATNSSDSGTRTFSAIGTFADGGAYYFQGYMSNVRWTTTAQYTSAFTPATSPLTAITNTQLLTCQSNRFIDNSSNALAITVNGNVSVQAFSPFAPTAAYSAATNGGSGYFDGSGDYLTMSSNAALAPGTGDFTIEAWLYPTAALSTYNSVYETAATNGLLFGKITSGYGVRSAGTADLISSTAPAINQWVHVAATRSGTDLRLFINGELKSTVTNSTNFATGSISLGASGSGTNPFPGYISGLRFVKGTALYTATFTVPTSPPTAVSNTNFLGNFTNAGITDATGKNVLETVGNAQISTTQSKFGGSSMYFDGTGDYLRASTAIGGLSVAFGTGDFTVEFWAYLTTTSGSQTFIDCRPGSAGNYLLIHYTSNSLNVFVNSSTVITGGALTANTWSHVALSRSGTSMKLFVNGTQVGSTATSSTNFLNPGANFPIIGSNYVPGDYLNGYIDDLRITSGYARYTGNFTPPAAAFPLQ